MQLKSVRFHREQYPTREHYPSALDILRRTSGLAFNTRVTLFVGENGTGKSTLLEALALKAGIYHVLLQGQLRDQGPLPAR
jgi:predicted ATPase